ncbi:Helix-turn-helix domain-containing protein [Xylanibacter ruminicola]|jgi:hypothetical protein|uniref:Helix-turn-helix domain-containing protein n=1 Tax=Xylanibacter ruminicola TaxID=839 RepID=A0A1M7D6I1_XYLRU|nr:helix-turn-helix domain-containing protein [Xylanibacter ruminicola]SHL75141.1 Helix-turn-helix domain-containing protein [Xylanibacter ruminicola]
MDIKIAKVDTNRLWISNKDAAAYLGVSKDWLKDRRNEGKLHYSVVGNTIFYIKKEIDNLIMAGAVSGRQHFQKAT